MDEYISRIGGRIDRSAVAAATIAVVGIGSVGGLVAVELARLIPRRLILVDGDDYEEGNRVRHPLPREYVGVNKAIAMSDYLNGQFPWIANLTPIPHHVSRDELQLLIGDVIDPAAIVVVATDDLEVQRHIARVARHLSTPAIVPGVGEDGETGEVFVSLTADRPCIHCFDSFRDAGEPVRAAAAMATDLHPTVQLTVQACLGLLTPDSREGRLFEPSEPGMPPPQYFRAYPPGSRQLQTPDDGRTLVPWRRDCPWCGGGRPQPPVDEIRNASPEEDVLPWHRATERLSAFRQRHGRRLLVGLGAAALLVVLGFGGPATIHHLNYRAAVLSHVPDAKTATGRSVRDSCGEIEIEQTGRLSRTPTEASYAARCWATSRAVLYIAFDSVDDLNAFYSDVVAEESIGHLVTDGRCYAPYREDQYSMSDGRRGRVFCYLDEWGAARLVWTDEERRIFGFLDSADRPFINIYRTWLNVAALV